MAAFVLPAACSADSQRSGGTPSSARSSASASVDIRASIDAGLAKAKASGTVVDFGAVRAVVVVQDGRTVYERYNAATADDYRHIASATKSVMSTLVGIAVAEKRLRLNDTLAALLPNYRSSMSPDVAAVTLRQLLTMTGGFPDTWAGSDRLIGTPDWVRAALTGEHSPAGQNFAYSDPGVHLIAAALHRAVGRSTLEYAREKLFTPLGINTRPALEPLAVPANFDAYQSAGFAWPVDPQGNHIASLKLRPVDMAAFGQLFLDGGRWRGRQLVPAEWVREATSSHIQAHGAGDGYGYLWWVGTADGDPAFRAWGYGGQLIEVIPRRRLVIVTSTEVDLTDPTSHGIEPGTMISIVDDFIAPVFR